MSSSVTAAIIASPLPSAARNGAVRADGTGLFGNVLSAKLSGPPADSQGPLSSAHQESAKKLEAISNKNSATTLAAQSDKRKSKDNLADAAAVAGTQLLPTQCFVPAAGGNLQPGKASLDGAPASLDGTTSLVPAAPDSGPGPMTSNAKALPAGDGAPALAGGRTALTATAPQPPISIVPTAGAQQDKANGSTFPTDKQDAAAAADPQVCEPGSAGDQVPSSAGPQTGVVEFAPEQQTSQAGTAETASREGVNRKVISSGTLRPEATQRNVGPSSLQDATQESGNPATASEMSNPANAGNAAVSAAQALSKLPPDTALPTLDDVANHSSGVNRSFDGPDHVERKKNSGSDSPPPLAPSEETEAPTPQFTINYSAESKTNALTQPVHAIATREQQQNADTPSNAVMPVAGHPAEIGPASRGDRSQVVSDPAASSAAENAQTVPTVIQSAQVLERMGKSEIRLGLTSSNFGSIELHTSVNQDRVGASIATSHADLRTAMIAEMPSLERAIAQHQMRLDSLQVDCRPGAAASDGNASGGNQSGPRSGTQSPGKISESSEGSAAQEAALPQAWTASHSGLNVHA